MLDLYGRCVVGWAFGHRLDSSLALNALDMALHHRKPDKGLLHHSDHGVQYASADYRASFAANDLLPRMIRTADPCDNAAMESFYSTLKTECRHRHDFVSRDRARAAVFDYIEVFYNRKRLHSALDFMSPVDFENKNN